MLDCKNPSLCGGCFYTHDNYEATLAEKEKNIRDLFKDIRGEYEFEKIIKSPLPFYYRNKMEYTFGDAVKNGPLKLGLHAKGSFYNICDVGDCIIAPKDFTKIVELTENFFGELEIPYFHKKKHTGYLRHLLIRKGIKTNEILINLVVTTQLDLLNAWSEKELLKKYTEILVQAELEKVLEGHIVGIIKTKNDSLGDAVKNQGVEIIYGRDYFYEQILNCTFKIYPFSFLQTNSLGADELYLKVLEYAVDGNPNKQNILDLYCGCGTIGQCLAPIANKIIGIEIVEEAIRAARENAEINNVSNADYYASDVGYMETDTEGLGNVIDLMVLDPPREGIIPKTLTMLINFNISKIIYVSCNPKSLIRDLPQFLDAGYHLKKVCPVDMFPWTKNLECVVMLVRN